MTVTRNYLNYRDAMIGHSMIPKEYLDTNFRFDIKPGDEDYDTYVEIGNKYWRDERVVGFVKAGVNLYLYSEYVGNGKTRWACEIAKQFMKNVNFHCSNENTPVIFVNFPTFLAKKKAAMTNPEVFTEDDKFVEINLTKAPLVIFDDIGDSDMSSYDYNELYSFVDARISNGLSCIFTSNSTPDDLDERIPAKLADRILGLSQIYEFKGGTKRTNGIF